MIADDKFFIEILSRESQAVVIKKGGGSECPREGVL